MMSKHKCDECLGNADYVYFDNENNKIVAKICQECRDGFDFLLQHYGKYFEEDSE